MAQAAATAAAASLARTSTTATCVSFSGASRIADDAPELIDHPTGAVNVAPPGVARGLSAVSLSGGAGDTAETASAADANRRRIILMASDYSAGSSSPIPNNAIPLFANGHRMFYRR